MKNLEGKVAVLDVDGGLRWNNSSRLLSKTDEAASKYF
jgi:hypothetical protein